VGDSQGSPLKYHYFHSFFTDSVNGERVQAAHVSRIKCDEVGRVLAARLTAVRSLRGQCQAGSLLGRYICPKR